MQQLTYVKLASSGSAWSVTLNGVDKAAYEAEFGAGVGVSTNTNHAGYTGTGFVDGFASSGDSVTFAVRADATGSHQLKFRYSTTVASTRTVYVDGVSVGDAEPAGAAELGHVGHRDADDQPHRRGAIDQDRIRDQRHQPGQPGGGAAMRRALGALIVFDRPPSWSPCPPRPPSSGCSSPAGRPT